MRFSLFIAFFLMQIAVFGQDSLAVNSTIKKAESLISSNHNKAIELFLEAIDLSQEKKFLEGEVKATYKLSDLYVEQLGDFKKADSLLEVAFEKAVAYDYEKGIAIIYLKRGGIDAMRGDFRRALEKNSNAIKYLQQLQDTTYLIIGIRNLGYTYGELTNYELAEKNLRIASEMAGLSNNYLQQAEILAGLVETKIRGQSLDNIQDLFVQLETLLENLDQEDVKNNFLEGRLYLNYANFYYAKNNYKTALTYTDKAFALMQKNQHILPTLMVLYTRIHNNLNNYKLAENFCRRGITLAKNQGNLNLEVLLQKEYLKILKLSNAPWNKYAQVADNVILLKDSIYNSQTLKEIANITERYEISQRDKELSEQKNIIQEQEIKLLKQQATTQILVIIGVVLILGLLGGYFILNQRRLLVQKRLQVLESRKKLSKIQDVLEGEDRERQRIAEELHDSVNGDLTVLKMKISNLKNTKKSIETETIPYVDKIITNIRQISHKLSVTALKHSSLVSALKDYLDEVKNASNYDVIFSVYGNQKDIDLPYKTSVFRIVQELITNTIKYAQASEIVVSMHFHKPYFEITVEDNGKGFDVSEAKKGIGLYNIESRANILQADFNIESSNLGTTASLKVYFDKLTLYQDKIAS